jgi:two-component system, OmpR family, sensor histidine kinase MtrB
VVSDTRPAAAEAAPATEDQGRVDQGRPDPGERSSWARAGAARLLLWWQSSLRVRVIVSTVVLGTVLTTLTGTLLYQRIAAGLVEQAVANAETDAALQVRLAQDLFDSTDRRDNVGLSASAFQTIAQISPGGQGDDRMVLLAQALDSDRDTLIAPLVSGPVTAAAVPRELREALIDNPNLQQVYVTRLSEGPVEDTTVVMVASRVQIPRAGPYDLVLIYPMDREQEILDLVQEWFLIGGLMLSLLVGGIGWLATRLVTEPVGEAAKVSQELARGELDERLPVHGTDELAQLAMSFNTMADSLQQQILQLEHLSQVQQRFVSDVSHELRTPLTTIRMAGEVLHMSRDEFSPTAARSAELLYGELDRFGELLDELLEISRYDSGTTVLQTHRDDLVALTRDVVSTVQPLAERLGSPLRVHAEEPEVLVEMDRRRVSRILRNLLVNAIEHGEGEPVDVTVCCSPDVAVVTVRDHGVGLSEEEVERVFERFWRADPARTRSTGGTGLGLSIAREDASLHGGWLQASGRPGQGACFRLVLPRTQDVRLPDPPPAASVAERDDARPPEVTVTRVQEVV